MVHSPVTIAVDERWPIEWKFLCNIQNDGQFRTELLSPAIAGAGDTSPPAGRLGLVALDPTGHGCVFVIPVHEPMDSPPPDPEQITLWSQITAHIANAYRIQRQLEAGEQKTAAHGEAIPTYEALGKNAELPAANGESLEELRREVIRWDRARTTSSQLDKNDVDELWRYLVAGRESLVDRFDRDGRRYYVARGDALLGKSPRALSAREEQVARQVALGHSNKRIANSLGLGVSTVSSHITNAARKLGVHSRLELIRAMRAWTAPPES
jgi:DNA-binding NarL/FixJ family response regulator